MHKLLRGIVMLIATIAVHIAILKNVFGLQSGISVHAVDADFSATAEIIVRETGLDEVPAPDLQLQKIPLEFPSLHEIDFDDSVEDELAQIIGPVSTPHLARVQSVALSTFARHAGLPAGVALTVLLRVVVTEDGSTGSADVARTSGNMVADAAAIAYALELRWVPGTIDRMPKTMRVEFPVIFESP